MTNSKSAQRLSASSEDSPRFLRCVTDGVGRCSTPFGIIGRLTKPPIPEKSDPNLCSTPFGIIGRLTKEVAPGKEPKCGCSTPFGIIGRLTHQLFNSCSLPLVLNAFRHHRKTHVQQGKRSLTSMCAQRLSASSEDSRAFRIAIARSASGAQRLSASSEDSLAIARSLGWYWVCST